MASRSVETRYSDPEHAEFLGRSVHRYVADMVRAGIFPRISQDSIDKATGLMVRNNEMAALIQTPEYRRNASGWDVLKIPDLIRTKKFGCIDGRDNVATTTDSVVEVWATPAGRVALVGPNGELLETWEADRYEPRDLRLASPDLIVKQQERARRDQELFVIAMAHAECAAWNNYIAPNLQFEDPTIPPEQQHARSLERYTLEPLRVAHNFFKGPNQIPLQRIGLSAILYPDSYDIVYQNNGDTLSAKDLADEFKGDLRRVLGEIATPGVFTEAFSGNQPMDLETHLSFTRRLLYLVEHAMDKSLFPSLHVKLEYYLNRYSPRFTELQSHLFKVTALRNAMLHNVVDFSQIPHHYYSEHREEGLGISERGNPPLQRDPIQALAISPANPLKSIYYSEIGLKVLEGALNSGPPYVVLIASDIPDSNYGIVGDHLDISDKPLQRASANNAPHFLQWINHLPFKTGIEAGWLLPIPVVVGQDSQKIYGVLDHSYQVARNLL